MISVDLTSSKYPRISYCGFKFFIHNKIYLYISYFSVILST
jgi:hypothetical protein